jgi:hypothetical protein
MLAGSGTSAVSITTSHTACRLTTCFPALTPVESQLASEGNREVIVFCLHIDKVTGVAED